MGKLGKAIGLFAVAAAVLTGCAAQTPAPSETATSSETATTVEGSGKFIFLPKSLNNPYWVDARKGMESAMAELGVEAEFLGPENDDAAAQVAIFESILATNPAGIAISANDPASVRELIAKAVAMGIPVIAWDGPIPDSDVFGYIGTDNVAAGRTLGETIAASLGGKGKIAVVIGSLSAVNLNQRLEGVKEALAAYPDIEIVATETSNESVADAQTAAETILQANPDLSAFVGIGGSDLPGIAGALQSSGKCGAVKAYGFDVVPQGIEGMRAACVDALISQRPFGMTAQALQILIDFSKGTSTLTPPFLVDTGVEIVTPATLEKFLTTPH
jgi:ABC-type sugar transport system substrate-binding protein